MKKKKPVRGKKNESKYTSWPKLYSRQEMKAKGDSSVGGKQTGARIINTDRATNCHLIWDIRKYKKRLFPKSGLEPMTVS